MNENIVFFDLEVDAKTKKVVDIGALKGDSSIHTASISKLTRLIGDSKFICGHNIINHDINYVQNYINTDDINIIDTLTLSPLLFPEKPYHSLVKDDKLQVDELNNPLNDSIKARDLLFDEINSFYKLNNVKQRIYRSLLQNTKEFKGFFKYVNSQVSFNVVKDIKREFKDKICENANVELMVDKSPIELAYALALIGIDDKHSITPPWVYKNYPRIENVVKLLRNTSCLNGCSYCQNKLNAKLKLKEIFGYDEFRQYNGEALQENAVEAAVSGESLLAIFPTGGGKSLTFQLPALIAGDTSKALTVVISPLQSLMKDQVDNLEKKGIVDAVTINGLLNPIERAEAIERVASGMASILYLSPESLRSRTVEKLLLSRNIARFVIDEAHCFSAWGQDFRVDYLYIGDFIKQLKEKKHINHDIPVSCFTATAKQKVVTDICEYFKAKLGLDLHLYTTDATRKNLQYRVLFKETEEDKYQTLRMLIEEKDCSTIVYVSRTHKAEQLANKLILDGFNAKAFHGKMETNQKIENQESFIDNQTQIIVATSAFGMGVDKSDVKLVVHYDISDSLENYVQEAGRAGRDQSLTAECYILFNNNDLDKHFILLNQTKLSINEIQQVWKAIKDMTRINKTISSSALEIARQAGWDETVSDIETRVRTAIAALENAGYVERGKNVPRIYATSILVKNMEEASKIIDESSKIEDNQKQSAKRIIKLLISKRSRTNDEDNDAESRIDYIADNLGLDKKEVIACVNLMREEGILADSLDLTLRLKSLDNQSKIENGLNQYIKLERFLLSEIENGNTTFSYKSINDKAITSGLSFATVQKIKTILYFWTIKGFIVKDLKTVNGRNVETRVQLTKINDDIDNRARLSQFIIEELFNIVNKSGIKEENVICFSILELQRAYKQHRDLLDKEYISSDEIQNTLLYLNKIKLLHLEGGFFVLYNGIQIHRLINDNKIKYKAEDYKALNEFYKQKIQQIHIVGEYAKLMVESYNKALEFVNDYFHMNYKQFLTKYFKENRLVEINRNITPEKFNQLFGKLSEAQLEIINDNESQYIVVAAGPGSGKTRVLVHKLASLMLMEDVKHEQLLMLTFSRAAAIEFKSRLIDLIGNAAHFIEIKTFHSYCFDLLGKIGNLEETYDVVSRAAQMIESGEVEIGRITKSVLVIDESQDMDENELRFIKALMKRNEEMRVIAVGDDDQNIYSFRGSNSKYFNSLISDFGAKKYELVDNYRSCYEIVSFANLFVDQLKTRMKMSKIRAISEAKGSVRLIKHESENLEMAIVFDLLNHTNNGTTAVLTKTNEEAIKINGILVKHGVKSKLIQSNEGFDLSKLVEVGYFLSQVFKNSQTPIISEEVWQESINNFKEVYKNSSCFDTCLDIFKNYSNNTKIKYKSDFEEFILETKYDDYVQPEQGVIMVSTMHKAKGREFDNVYMLVSNDDQNTDETKRSLYVGMTRAKNNLSIHYKGKEFDKYKENVSQFSIDSTQYNESAEININLTHRDVFLDFFKGKQNIIKGLRSGDKININNEFANVIRNGKSIEIVKFSQRFINRSLWLKSKGYKPKEGIIRFIVSWKGEKDEKDCLVVLPNITFIKDDLNTYKTDLIKF